MPMHFSGFTAYPYPCQADHDTLARWPARQAPALALAMCLAGAELLAGCSVVGATVAVGSAAVSTAATVGSAAVSVASTAVGTTYDVTKAGVKAVAGSDS